MKKLMILIILVFLAAITCKKADYCWECKVDFFDGKLIESLATQEVLLVVTNQDSTTRYFCDMTEKQIERYEKDVTSGVTPRSACGDVRWITCKCTQTVE